jgi:hypothetical protein
MCPCCQNLQFKEREGFVCAECSFRYIAVREEQSLALVFCEGCGCNYLGSCPTHSLKDLKPFKF